MDTDNWARFSRYKLAIMTDVDREEKGKEKQFGNPFLIRKLLILLSFSLPFFPIRMPELTREKKWLYLSPRPPRTR